MSDNKVFFVTGKARWAKVIGKPPMDELAGRRMWSLDLYPEDIKAFATHLKTEKVNKKLKDKGEGKYVTFTRNEKNKDGGDNKPIPIFDNENNPWDDRLIGNDSVVTVRYRLNKSDKYGNIVWVDAIKVKEYVPYEGKDLFPEDDDDFDAPKKKAADNFNEDLDDDPF